MENSNNETQVKKSKKGLLTVLAVIVIAILAGVAYYFLRPISPKDAFVSKINAVIDNSSQKYITEGEIANSTITLKGNIQTDNEEVKQITQHINQGKIMVNVQADTKLKKASLSADIDYQNQNILSGKVFFQNDDNIYVYVQDLFDKYFKFDLKEILGEDEQLNRFKQILSGTLSEKVQLSKANNILKNAISENLKDEYFSKEAVDGSQKNTIKLTVSELKQIVKKVATSLKDNQDYLKCFEKADEVKNSLEDLIQEIDNSTNDYDNYIIEISIYTKGIVKSFEKLEVKILNVEEVIVKATVTGEKIDNETKKFIIETDNIKDFGKATIEIEVKNTKNTDLENVDVSNSININEMSTQDAIKLYTNLTKMKLYPYIAPFLGEQQ